MASARSGLCTQSVMAWPPRLARLRASAVPHAPAPMMAIWLMRRRPSILIGGSCVGGPRLAEAVFGSIKKARDVLMVPGDNDDGHGENDGDHERRVRAVRQQQGRRRKGDGGENRA